MSLPNLTLASWGALFSSVRSHKFVPFLHRQQFHKEVVLFLKFLYLFEELLVLFSKILDAAWHGLDQPDTAL